MHDIAGWLAKMHPIPKKVDAMLQRMNTNCASHVEAEELELITLNWRSVFEKPAG